MGLLFSSLQAIMDCFRGSRARDYNAVITDSVTPPNTPNIEKTCSGEKPKLHKACRSTNESKLIPYQNKIDNLKASEIVYVNILIFFWTYIIKYC